MARLSALVVPGLPHHVRRVVMDEAQPCAGLAYIVQNPVRARLVERATDWPWSSVHAHLSGQPDGLTKLEPVRERYPRFSDLIDMDPDAPAFDRLRRAETIGRPLGDAGFITLETQTQRRLRPAKRGSRPKDGGESGNLFSALSPKVTKSPGAAPAFLT